MKKFMLFSLVLLIAPFQVCALSLGEHKVNSYINQPLSLAIKVTGSDIDDIDGIVASHAEAVYYQYIGLEQPINYGAFVFDVNDTEDGIILNVQTDAPIRDSYVNFILQVDHKKQRIYREIGVLLEKEIVFEPAPVVEPPEPVVVAKHKPKPAPVVKLEPIEVPEPVVVKQPEPEPIVVPEIPLAKTYPIEPEPTPEPVVIAIAEPVIVESPAPQLRDWQYKVRRGDTLWGITSRFFGHYDYHIQQKLASMLSSSPEAFIRGNMNLLRVGALLKFPSYDEMGDVEQAAARELYAEDLVEFEAYRERVRKRRQQTN